MVALDVTVEIGKAKDRIPCKAILQYHELHVTAKAM